MSSVDQPRVFVGLDGSLASLRALRWAVWEARRSGGEVHAVHVRPAATPEREVGLRGAARRVDAGLDRRSEALIAKWVRDALGGPPADVAIQPRVVTGRPGPALAGRPASVARPVRRPLLRRPRRLPGARGSAGQFRAHHAARGPDPAEAAAP